MIGNGKDPFVDPETSIIVTVVFSLVGFALSQWQQHNETIIQISATKNAHEVKRYSTPDDAILAIKSKIAGAQTVKNTFFPNKNERISGAIQNVDAHLIYNDWLRGSAGTEWRDVVGPEEIFDERFQKIGQSVHVSGEKRHIVHVLNHQNSCPNFVILTYPNGFSEVFWGWISKKHAETNQEMPFVFSSSEKELVEFYSEMFDLLWDRRVWDKELLVVHKAAKKSMKIGSNQIVDKVGRWATFSKFDNKINTFGIYDITVGSDAKGQRGFSMNGITTNDDFTVKAIDSHNRNEIQHYENRMFIEFGRNSSSKNRGVCFYKFSGDGGTHLKGFYRIDDSQECHSIFGIKVDPEDDISSYQLGSQVDAKLQSVFLNVIEEARKVDFFD